MSVSDLSAVRLWVRKIAKISLYIEKLDAPVTCQDGVLRGDAELWGTERCNFRPDAELLPFLSTYLDVSQATHCRDRMPVRLTKLHIGYQTFNG